MFRAILNCINVLSQKITPQYLFVFRGFSVVVYQLLEIEGSRVKVLLLHVGFSQHQEIHTVETGLDFFCQLKPLNGLQKNTSTSRKERQPVNNYLLIRCPLNDLLQAVVER